MDFLRGDNFDVIKLKNSLVVCCAFCQQSTEGKTDDCNQNNLLDGRVWKENLISKEGWYSLFIIIK